MTLSRNRQAADYQTALEDCRKITAQVQAMVENLTSLARVEAGQVSLQFQPVVLNELVRTLWGPLATRAQKRRLVVHTTFGSDDPLTTDPLQLAVVVRNLLENAVAHADDGGSVKISTLGGEHEASLTVTNSGSRLPADQVEKVFQRFWRGDAARSETGLHCGLGLSLVKKIVALLGGTIRVRSALGGEFEIRVSLPK